MALPSAGTFQGHTNILRPHSPAEVVCMRQMEAFIQEHNMQMDQKDRQIEALEEKVFCLDKKCEALERQLGSKEA